MKSFFTLFLLGVVVLTGTSCTTLDQTNTNYSRPYRQATGYYAGPRVDPYGAPGIWDVRQGGGSTGISYRN